MTVPRVQLDNISKSFPGVKALDRVSFSVMPGEVHAVCGENGAGKSTLMNILAGNVSPDEGNIIVNGKHVSFARPQQAFDAGIAIVHQHLSLCENLSIAENIFVNRAPSTRFGFIRYDSLFHQAEDLLRALNTSLDPRQRVAHLSAAQKQMVEIAKALSLKPQILILDEPTASLTATETATLFSIIRRFRRDGFSVLYISHRLPEIFEVADTITVLKDGKHQGTLPARQIDHNELIRLMVGRDLQERKKSVVNTGEVVLEVSNLSNRRLRNITFNVRRGEIVGLAGLVGAGRTEIARAIFGADKLATGAVRVAGKDIDLSHPARAMDAGIAYVPEDRKALGLFPQMSVRDNIASTMLGGTRRSLVFDSAAAKRHAEIKKDQLRIVTPSLEKKVLELSGGNQQKVVLSRWLITSPDVLIVDEPTHGIDIGAKYEIYDLLERLKAEGKAVLMISSELPELLNMCDRILVVRDGRIAGELSREQATEENIMALATPA